MLWTIWYGMVWVSYGLVQSGMVHGVVYGKGDKF